MMKGMRKWIGLGLYFACSFAQLNAQNYQAINGSPFAGSLGVHNNPSSIVTTPYKWDLTIFGTQLKTSTNIVNIYNYSLLSNPQNSLYAINDGEFERYGRMAFNTNLLNARIALGRGQAIAFGANLKSYTNVASSTFNFIDTLHQSGDFFKINQPGNELSAMVRSSSWAELYGSYARTIIDYGGNRLNAGITLKLNRGLSAGILDLANGSYRNTGTNQYNVDQAFLKYIYSANYDKIDKSQGNEGNAGDFLRFTNGGLAFDFGVEYLLRESTAPDFNSSDDYYDYTWKLGASLLDAGFTTYKAGLYSRQVHGVIPGLSNEVLDNKFDSTITSLQSFTDSLSTISSDIRALYGDFHVLNPTRLVLNADRYLQGNFFINAEIVINLSQVLNKYMGVKDLNAVTVTPRWETRTLGAYLPIQYTSTNKLWIGGAFKAGPLLFGVHNWANLFSKTKINQGGAYLAIIIRAKNGSEKKYDKRLDCPPY